jgi:hypothetical protein
MGYIRKHKHGIRSGFEATVIMAFIFSICPTIMILASSAYYL